jgi:3-phenylpropionate/trans-cinnamate dioxygenase ferredoxin reductase subunit
MNTLHFKYVLVGGGGAGSAAAESIRKHDPQGSILLVGQEHSRPYLRPALSKQYLRRSRPRLELAADPSGWYIQNKIELRTGRRAAHLDTARRAIILDNGEEITFNKLLLATGASPKLLKIPGAELPNVFYLRTIDDCDRLHHAIDKAKLEGRPHPPHAAAERGSTMLTTGRAAVDTGSDTVPDPSGRGRAVVIGNGLLAVEVAASLRQIDLHVELVIGRSYPWGKFAGENTGKFIARYLESRGVTVHTGTPAERVEGDGRVQRVVMSDGTSIECDFLVAASGVTVNRELLRGTPIAAEKAILVDERCRTNVADIYAAGDCAAILDPLFAKHRLLDHWDSARVTGAIAGANMAGAQMKYDIVNTFNSEVFDLKLHAWGEGRFVHHRLVRGAPTPESPSFAEIGVASDGRVCQVLAIGRNDEHESFRELVARRFNVDGHEEAIKDPAVELGQILR